jgi:predicted SAM-dependent methyltransferase
MDIMTKEKRTVDLKLHLGCGKRNFGEDWIHIDGGDYDHLDSKDIINLPYENNKVDLIYAAHVIEYWDRDGVKDLLKEWYRVLRSGGVLRLAVPNFRVMAQLYIQYGEPLDSFLGPLYGKMPMGEETIYHKTTYDFDSLATLLEEIGFSDIRRWDWREVDHGRFDDHSQAYLPHMDKENGALISLNVEAIK